jgi:hypothetical protein
MTQDSMRDLARAAVAAPSADNSQPWRFHITGARLSVRAPAQAHFFGPADHPTLLSVGAVAENLALSVAAPGGGGRLEMGDLSRGDPYFDFELDQSDAPVVIPQQLLDRHTNRHPFTSKPLPAELVAQIEAVAEGSARVLVLSAPDKLRAFTRISTTCCRCRFRNPELHRWLMDSLRHTPEEVAKGDGLDIRTLHLPPGGAAFMRFIKDWRRMEVLNRLGAYRLMAQAEADVLQKSAALILIVGADGLRPAFDAGRLMERIWITLNANGWGVQPAYVVPDQANRLRDGSLPKECRAEVAGALEALQGLLELPPGERLHMVLRTGWPTKVPARSRRLALDLVV